MTASRRPHDDWNRLKPDTTEAVEDLARQLRSGTSSSQDLLDTYLYAKRLLAESMQAFIRTSLPERCEEFHQLRDQLAEQMQLWYGDRLPESYLSVPYGFRVHEELFSILFQRMGQNVEAALLRVVTGDSVHTERRTRELRELGMAVTSYKANDIEYYCLKSLDLDHGMINSIILKTAKKKGFKPVAEKDLKAVLGEG
ncbi:hypothetical protein ACFWNN_36275 [Lentzea sp. NPDC058450]|uniref:hypothetical protein n=1 Tax=Lentzea sp. NPDC058450 TaxID=3346505 RepID=UPI003666AF8B